MPTQVRLQTHDGKMWKSGKVEQWLTHRVKTDYEIGRNNRPNLPMVFVFNDNRVQLTKEWQMYFVAINYGMRKNNISHMWDDNVAFCNNTGFQGKEHRKNWIMLEDMENELPQHDKTRTCGDARLRMIPTGKIIQTWEITLPVGLSRQRFEQLIGGTQIAQQQLVVMDGSKPPLLKPGKVYPMTTEEAYTSWHRYQYNPINHPEYFFPAVVTGGDNQAHAWPNAASYSWYHAGTEPVAWMWHMASSPVYYPPMQWTDNTPYLAAL